MLSTMGYGSMQTSHRRGVRLFLDSHNRASYATGRRHCRSALVVLLEAHTLSTSLTM